MANEIQQFKSETDFKYVLANQYVKQINNFFGDDKRAMKFLSAVMSAVQRTPQLLSCRPATLINSFMTMAELGLMPSGVSGEAYVLPYNTKNNGMEAQFQLGYQGLVTLFYRAGGQKIRAEIIRENDEFSCINGEIKHAVDMLKSNEERGKPVGAYAIATLNDNEVSKFMNATDILAFGARFSKSYNTKFTPWNQENDPELWMWKKTVLKQLGKMLPKNETINKAIEEDNRDSVIHDRIEAAKNESKGLTMGAALVGGENALSAPQDAPATPPEAVHEAQTVAPPIVEPEKPTTPPEENESPNKKRMREAAEQAKGK